MMIKRLFFFAAVLGIWMTSLSNRGGRGLLLRDALTLAPGENGRFCGSFGCHFSGNFDPVFHVRLLDENQELLDSYVPEQQYDILVTYESTGTPAGFGFQMVSLTAEDNEAVNGWSDFPGPVHEAQIGDRQYVEQNNVIMTDSLLLKWTAPASGSGDIIFYLAGNLVNGNGSPGNDGSDTTQLRISEAISSSIFDLSDIVSEDLYSPNPSQGYLSTNHKNIDKVEVFNLAGQRVHSTNYANDMNLDFLNPGKYLVIAHTRNGKRINQKIIIE